MLQTVHDQEFYLTKAREHELLEEVIDGTATMRSTLDALIKECDWTTHCSHGKLAFTKDLIEYLEDYFSVVSELSAEEVSCKLGKDREWVHNLKGGVVLYAGSGAVSAAVVYVLWPILPLLGDILAFPLLAGGFIRLKDAVVRKPRDRALQKKRDEILGPLYNVVDEIDQDIGKCFTIEHYHNARPRFEQTYAALTADERAPVHDYLFGLLGAGGMPDMDQTQLKDYLSGLLASEGDG